MTTVEFYFDLSSPWTCVAFHNIQPIIKRKRIGDHLETVSRRRRVQCGEPDAFMPRGKIPITESSCTASG